VDGGGLLRSGGDKGMSVGTLVYVLLGGWEMVFEWMGRGEFGMGLVFVWDLVLIWT